MNSVNTVAKRTLILMMLGWSVSGSISSAQVFSTYQKISEISGGGLVFDFVSDNNENFGRSVIQILDLNGDGARDLAVGAVGEEFDPGEMPTEKPPLGPLDQGAVFIVLTHPNADGTVLATTKIASGVGGFPDILDLQDEFGRALATIGDFNNDGVRDIAVGAPGDDDGAFNSGAIYLLLLNEQGHVVGHHKISATEGGNVPVLANGDAFGSAIAAIGDLDLNGVRDIVVGAPGDDDSGQDSGAVHILLLESNGTVLESTKISNPDPSASGDYFGDAVSSVGDPNGDGVADLVVGAPRDHGGGNERGAIFLFFLNVDGSFAEYAKINDIEGTVTEPLVLHDNDWFGSAIHQVGDLDGDGDRELAVGAPQDEDAGGYHRGALYLLFLEYGPDYAGVTSHVKVSPGEGNLPPPLADGDRFGESIVGLGDFDGDGNYDLAVGATGDNDNIGGYAMSNQGAVYMLFLDE